MKLDTFRKRTSELFEPDTIVVTATAKFHGLDMLWKAAYSTKEELKEDCFWLGNPEFNTKIVAMTAEEYVTQDIQINKAMNVFWSIGRVEFIAEWAKVLKRKDK